MPSRNSLINGPGPEFIGSKPQRISYDTTIGKKEVHVKPFASFLWDSKTGEKKIFRDSDEHDEALKNGWVDTPAKIQKPDEIDWGAVKFKRTASPSGAMVEEAEYDKDYDDDVATMTDPMIIPQSRDYTKPRDPFPKFLHWQNKAELVITGRKYGLDFDRTDRSLTNKKMRELIRREQKKAAAKARRKKK